MPKKPHVDPKNIVLWWDELGSLGLRGISLRLRIPATSPENLMSSFLLGIQITAFQNFRSSRFGLNNPTALFPGKNPGRWCVTFFKFSQRRKVSLFIVLNKRNYEKKNCFSPFARDIHSRWAAPRLSVSAELPLKLKNVIEFWIDQSWRNNLNTNQECHGSLKFMLKLHKVQLLTPITVLEREKTHR